MAEAKNATDEVAVFGTKEVSLKEFMGTSKKNLVVLEDYDKAKENLLELKVKHEARITELIAKERLTKEELKELIAIRGELRNPRYLIQNLKKDNVSVFATYSKNDKSKWDDLIEINEPLEDTADAKIKSEEAIVQAEKELEAQAEENRINTIKERIDTFETDSYKIIQSTTFDDVELNKTMLDALANTDFDYEEYDILFEQAKGRVQASWDSKCTDVKQREEQRLENERMKQEIFDVRVDRLKEVGFSKTENGFTSDFFGVDISDVELHNSTSTEFENLLSDIKTRKEDAEQAKRDAEIKKEKDEQFEVRKNRLVELYPNYNFDVPTFSFYGFTNKEIYDADIVTFETIMQDAKKSIQEAKEQKEANAKESLYQERVKLLLQLGLTYDSTKEYPIFLEGNSKLIANREVLVGRNQEWFDEFVSDVKTSIAITEKEAKKEADAENKARVKRLAKDKKDYNLILQGALCSFPKSFDLAENKEVKDFSIEASNKVADLLNDLLTQLNDL